MLIKKGKIIQPNLPCVLYNSEAQCPGYYFSMACCKKILLFLDTLYFSQALA